MKKALDECLSLQEEWKILEAEHIRLKNKVARGCSRRHRWFVDSF